MCFSATASFGASAAIAVIAVATIRKASTTGSYLVACIPLFFSIQQAFEGLLWISLCHPDFQGWQALAKNGFLIFATVVWPILLPLISWMLERKEIKKKILAGFCVLGTGVGLYFLYSLAAHSVTPIVQGSHIRYVLHFPGYNKDIMTVVYFVATVVPLLISSVRPLRWFGVLLLVSLCVTAFFYTGYFISVWCYFAAILSLVSFVAVGHLKKL